VSSESRWITANFKETDIADIHVGARVKIDIDALPGKDLQGTVSAISSATGATFTLLPPDNATGNFTKVVQRVPVNIRIENLSEDEMLNLRAGLSAYVKIYRH
jgi:membrane fusion protein (multidrug efflux system)